MSSERWTRCLDSFSQHLVQQRQAVADGDLGAITAFVPDPGLPPLPAALDQRARNLLAEADQLQTELAAATKAVQRQLALLPSSPMPHNPRFIDAHG